MVDKVIVWGGLGEKRSNGGTQWYLQDRVYCVDGLCPALNSFVRGCLVIVPFGDCDDDECVDDKNYDKVINDE